jgi:hypothetical protein
MDFHDRLFAAAEFLGRLEESEYRQACNDDPDGDGYDLCAAEHGMTSSDYFRSRVWDRAYELAGKLSEMPKEDQEVLLAIYEGWSPDPWVEPTWRESLREMLPADLQATLMPDDEIPF